MNNDILRNFILPIFGALEASGSLINMDMSEGIATIRPISVAAAPRSDRNSGKIGRIIFVPSQNEKDAIVSISTTIFMVKTILNT